MMKPIHLPRDDLLMNVSESHMKNKKPPLGGGL